LTSTYTHRVNQAGGIYVLAFVTSLLLLWSPVQEPAVQNGRFFRAPAVGSVRFLRTKKAPLLIWGGREVRGGYVSVLDLANLDTKPRAITIPHSVSHIAIAPKKQIVLVASAENPNEKGALWLVDLATGAVESIGHIRSAIRGLVISPHEDALIVQTYPKTEVWPELLNQVTALDATQPFVPLAVGFSGDNRAVLLTDGKRLSIVDIDRKTTKVRSHKIQSTQSLSFFPFTAVFSPDGRSLALGLGKDIDLAARLAKNNATGLQAVCLINDAWEESALSEESSAQAA
jgi:WD40 repeat protein